MEEVRTSQSRLRRFAVGLQGERSLCREEAARSHHTRTGAASSLQVFEGMLAPVCAAAIVTLPRTRAAQAIRSHVLSAARLFRWGKGSESERRQLVSDSVREKVGGDSDRRRSCITLRPRAEAGRCDARSGGKNASTGGFRSCHQGICPRTPSVVEHNRQKK